MKLLPEQISKAWAIYRETILSGMPPNVAVAPETGVAILHSLLTDQAQLWLYLKKGQPWGIVCTTLFHDPVINQKYLYLYTVFAFAQLHRDDIEYGLDILSRYARFVKASGLVTYTNIDSVRQLLHRYGGVTEYTFTFIPI